MICWLQETHLRLKDKVDRMPQTEKDTRGAWQAQWAEPATLDLRIVTLSPTLGLEII